MKPQRTPAMPILGRAAETFDDCIFLTGVEVLACHGVLPQERTCPQRFVIDAHVWVDVEGCAIDDDYRQAVCYGAVRDALVEVANGPHKSLVEALALAMVEELLRRFSQIEQVRIAVHKPDAPLGGKFADVGVSLTRRRRIRC